MTQSDICAFCDRPHLFHTQVTWGDMPVYFCSVRCRNSWLSIHNSQTIRLCTLALTFFLCLTFPAQAEWDGEEGKMSEWFQSLFDQNGRSCCGSGDYHRVNYRGNDNGTQIEWKGKWYDVPDVAKVKNFSNPTGEGAAFFYENEEGAPREIFCFIRAVEG
jgi:hypothetical protein